jgi:hypothetical protein
MDGNYVVVPPLHNTALLCAHMDAVIEIMRTLMGQIARTNMPVCTILMIISTIIMPNMPVCE